MALRSSVIVVMLKATSGFVVLRPRLVCLDKVSDMALLGVLLSEIPLVVGVWKVPAVTVVVEGVEADPIDVVMSSGEEYAISMCSNIGCPSAFIFTTCSSRSMGSPFISLMNLLEMV